MPSIKNSVLLLVIILSSVEVFAQSKLSKEALRDFSNQAERQVRLFFDNVEQLGASELKPETKQKAINSVVKTFTPKGTVEERSKLSKKGKTRNIRDYLEAIKVRGENTKVLISYDITDKLTPDELTTKVNPDNSITYMGEITIRQFYCRLKEKNELTDNLTENCAYSDTTYKKIYIEFRILKDDQRNVSFAVLIDKIVVLSVK